MPNSELNRTKSEFKKQMNGSFKLIQSVNKIKIQPHFSQDQIYMIYELSFLKIFLAWEWFVENTFISYMLGKKTNKGYGPKTYVKPIDQHHAYNFVKRKGRDYADWTNPSTVIEKSTLFFEDGKPYKDTFGSIIGEMQNMKTIRNAIVHMSTKSRESFETLIRNKLEYAKMGITPGEFLFTTIKGKNLSYITYYGDQMEVASERIVK